MVGQAGRTPPAGPPGRRSSSLVLRSGVRTTKTQWGDVPLAWLQPRLLAFRRRADRRGGESRLRPCCWHGTGGQRHGPRNTSTYARIPTLVPACSSLISTTTHTAHPQHRPTSVLSLLPQTRTRSPPRRIIPSRSGPFRSAFRHAFNISAPRSAHTRRPHSPARCSTRSTWPAPCTAAPWTASSRSSWPRSGGQCECAAMQKAKTAKRCANKYQVERRK